MLIGVKSTSSESAVDRCSKTDAAPPRTPHLPQLAAPSWQGGGTVPEAGRETSVSTYASVPTQHSRLSYRKPYDYLPPKQRQLFNHTICCDPACTYPLTGLPHAHAHAHGQARVRAPEATMSAASRVRALTLPLQLSLLSRNSGSCCYYSSAAATRALPGSTARCRTFSQGVGAAAPGAWRVEGVRWISSASSSSSSAGSEDGESVASSQTSRGGEPGACGEAQPAAPAFAFAFE